MKQNNIGYSWKNTSLIILCLQKIFKKYYNSARAIQTENRLPLE